MEESYVWATEEAEDELVVEEDEEEENLKIINEELANLSLPKNFGGILDDLEKEFPTTALKAIKEADDSFLAVFTHVIHHKKRRGGEDDYCDCLTKHLENLDEKDLKNMIVESRNFIRVDGNDIYTSLHKLVQSK